MKQVFSNNFETTLNASIGTSDTSCVLVDASGMQTLGTDEYEVITLNNGTDIENIKVTSRTGNIILVMERAWDDTTATAFASGVAVTGEMSAQSATRLNQNIRHINAQTGTSYTAVIGDAGGLVTMSNASANTYTVPPNSSVAFEINTKLYVAWYGVGVTTLVAGSGVTINTPRSLGLYRRYSMVELIKVDADEWMILDAGTQIESFVVAVSDELTDLTIGATKVTWRMPYAFTLLDVRSNCKTAPTGAALTTDINKEGVSILSTVLSIDAAEKTSTTAATSAVISDTSLADDVEMTADIGQIGSTIAGTGLKIALIGYQTT